MGDDTAIHSLPRTTRLKPIVASIHSIPRTARLKPIVTFLGLVDRSLAISYAVESYRYGVDASWMTKYGKTENHGTTEPRNNLVLLHGMVYCLLYYMAWYIAWHGILHATVHACMHLQSSAASSAKG